FDAFSDRFGLNASVVCAVDLVRGLGISAGMRAVSVPGATGAIKTDFAAKAQAAMDELKQGQDLVFLHIESADEAGHQGQAATKIWSVEQIDQ
ncbi:MAG: phosphoglycerate mutase, partial [Syntrophomonadaceae bacterium]|nr:phosphoglycerate mutase [Syntrophomonadaceae bacterium]